LEGCPGFVSVALEYRQPHVQVVFVVIEVTVAAVGHAAKAKAMSNLRNQVQRVLNKRLLEGLSSLSSSLKSLSRNLLSTATESMRVVMALKCIRFMLSVQLCPAAHH
jgi:hypothetical protein